MYSNLPQLFCSRGICYLMRSFCKVLLVITETLIQWLRMRAASPAVTLSSDHELKIWIISTCVSTQSQLLDVPRLYYVWICLRQIC